MDWSAGDNVPYHDFFDAGWAGGLFRPVLIAVLATCAVAGPLAILRAVTSWHLGYVLPLVFAVAVVGTYSTRQQSRPNWRVRRGWLLRSGELVLLLLVVRLAVWLFSTGLPGPAVIRGWLRHPATFFDLPFVFVGLLAAGAWLFAIHATSSLLELGIQPDEIASRRVPSWAARFAFERVFRPTSRAEIVGRLISLWSTAGVFLVLSAALSRLEVTTDERRLVHVGIGQLGLPVDILAALLGYFLAGLLLFSQARFAILRSRWQLQDTAVRPEVQRRWHLSSTLVLLVVAGLAAFLPIGSTGWLARALLAVIGFVMYITQMVVMAVTYLLALISSLLSPLLGRGDEQPLPAPSLELPQERWVFAPQLPDWLGGAVLWAVVSCIAGYLLLSYLRAQGWRWPFGTAWLERLRFWGRARRARLRASWSSAWARLPLGRGRRRQPAASSAARRRFLRRGPLEPHEVVRYFYLRAVERAGEVGVSRPPHRTPAEFAGDLRAHWPDAGGDVEDLTQAFIRARYDRRPVDSEQAGAAGTVWRRVMRALRKTRSDAGGGSPQ